jgi:aspartate aminotransferase-like enzyme/GNAT superfamily N-acetyltransferase
VNHPSTTLTFKLAKDPSEFDQIHSLNYRIFVEEIPQHSPNNGRRLIDRFHDENIYVICLDGQRLVAMVAIRARRPFSLDAKLRDLDTYLPPASSPCEIRLLAVEPDRRRGPVLSGLLANLAAHAREYGHNLALISGAFRQLKLYRHLGFVPFGPMFGTREAAFQPMYLRLERFTSQTQPLLIRLEGRFRPQASFIPGPVAVSEKVLCAASAQPTSHRSPQLCDTLAEVRRRLCDLTCASAVEILFGSGTLANDAVAAQLTLRRHRGLVLDNGEFGGRLVDHARRFNLDFDILSRPWGAGFDRVDLSAALDRQPPARWLWAVHCDTSAGVLNNLTMLKTITAARGIDLCLDCVSSIGAVPVDLKDVYLATGVSGKALGALPGLAFVFHRDPIAPAKTLPRYLDLGLYARARGAPFTLSSNLLNALLAALRAFDPERFAETARLGYWLRQRLRAMGVQIVAPEMLAAPAVVSIALPDTIKSLDIGTELEAAGFLLSYRSEYLVAHNWIQVALMGQYSPRDLMRLVDLLDTLVRRES